MRKGSALLATLLTLLMIIGVAPRASAQHYVWLVDDGAQQTSSWSGYENWINYWVVQNISIAYWADTSADTWATTAVTNWSKAIPQIRTYKASTKSSADVTFEVGTCANPNWIACHSLINVYSDPDRKANYIKTSKVLLDTSKMTSGYEAATAAHEFGHHLGMHEQYNEAGGCNPNVVSIMDAQGCDGAIKGPTSWDVARVNEFYGDGTAGNVQYQILSGTNVEIRWKDQSAGELHYEVVFSNYSTGTEVARVQVRDNIGLKAGLSWVADRTITYTWVPPSNGSYRACVRPYFSSWNKFGTQACSSAFYYS